MGPSSSSQPRHPMLKIVNTYVDVATPGRHQHPARKGRTGWMGQGIAAPRREQKGNALPHPSLAPGERCARERETRPAPQAPPAPPPPSPPPPPPPPPHTQTTTTTTTH